MRRARAAAAAGLAAALAAAGVAWADHPLLLADATCVAPGTTVRLRHALCRPFAGAAAPVVVPQTATVHAPDGTFVDLTPQMPKDAPASDWALTFEAKLPGDHVVVVHGQPFEQGDDLVTDFVKLVVHVDGSEDGWDRALRTRLEVVPLTRPYGLPAGATFRGQVSEQGKPVVGARVRIEPWVEGGGPADTPQHLQHRLEKTDAGGAFAVTLDRPGFWMVSAEQPSRTVQRGNKRYTELLRATLWVRVGVP